MKSKPSRLLVLYASQTGNAMDAAERIGREAERGGCPAIHVLSIDRFDAVSHSRTVSIFYWFQFYFHVKILFLLCFSFDKTSSFFTSIFAEVFARWKYCYFRSLNHRARWYTRFNEGWFLSRIWWPFWSYLQLNVICWYFSRFSGSFFCNGILAISGWMDFIMQFLDWVTQGTRNIMQVFLWWLRLCVLSFEIMIKFSWFIAMLFSPNFFRKILSMGTSNSI